MTIEISVVTPMIAENKQDSFWYSGQVATVTANNKTMSIEASGSIAVSFTEEGDMFTDEMAVKEANNLGLTDKDLDALDTNGGSWGFNNWFAIVELNSDGSINNLVDDGIAHTYNEAIEVAKDLLR